MRTATAQPVTVDTDAHATVDLIITDRQLGYDRPVSFYTEDASTQAQTESMLESFMMVVDDAMTMNQVDLW